MTDAAFAARLPAMRAMLISSALVAAIVLSTAAAAAPTSLLPTQLEAVQTPASLAPLAADSAWTPRFEAAADELVAALSAELAEASGAPVMALSGASGAGVPAILDKLLEIIGPEKRPVVRNDDGEETTDWSPV